MARGGSLLITVLILQCIILSLANQNLVPMFISEIDTFLETDRDIVSEGSVFACVKQCAETSGCKSINYKKQGAGNNCYLNKKNRREAGEAAVQADNNFVHYTIDYHTQRSEQPEFGTTNIDMPVIPPIVIAAAEPSPTTAAPPTTPAVPPTTPAAPPTTLAAPPTTPAASPRTPAAPPPTPAASPTTPAAQPTAPAAPPTTPAASPTTPAASPTTPAASPTTPAASPTTTAAPTTTPAASPTTPAAPAASPTTPAASPTTPAASPTTPAASPTTPAAPTTTPAASPTTPAPPTTPAASPTITAASPTTPAAPPTTTAASPTTTAAPPTTTAAPPGLCDSNPCQNGGACTEVSAENRYKCSCTALFTGTNCQQAVSPPTTQTPAMTAPPSSGACDSNPCKNGATCSEDGNGFKCRCVNAFSGKQCDQPFKDFELIFGGTDTINYVTYSLTNNWFSEMTTCAWIYTPDIAENQTMTVINIRTVDSSGNKKVITEQIDGQGGFYFSFGADWSNHPSRFSSTSSKDSWICLCVRFNSYNQPYIEAIVNANEGSKVSNNKFNFANVKVTKVVIGQDQDKNGNVINTHPFEGRISGLTIWKGIVDPWNMNEWYQKGWSSYPPEVNWPSFGDPGNRVGDVHYVKFTSARRTWRSVTQGELVINKTSNVAVAFTTDADGLVMEISQSTPAACSDQDSAPVDGLVILVPGAWKRIAFEQIFLETQHCYAIFGSVPSWASGYDPGVKEFDPNEDEIWKAEFLGVGGVHEYSGVNTLCGSGHFWMVNHPQGNRPTAGISLSRKWGAQNAGISTFGKCGSFKFKIKNIKVLN